MEKKAGFWTVNKSDKMRTELLIGIIAFVVSCGEQGRSITEAKRQNLSPHVAQFLIEGQRAHEAGVYDMALAYTDSVEAYAPDLADLHFLRGAIYTRLNRPDVAQAAYETVLELDPWYPGARHNMGLNAFRRGQLRSAINLYLEEESEVGGTATLYHELGRAYAKLGEPDSARTAYEAAIALDSTHATSYMWLGQLLEEAGDLEAALELSLKGLALQPTDLDYQYIVGTQYRRLEQPELAMPYLEPVAMAWPWHQGAQTNLGQVYMQLGREEEARDYFARADVAQQQAQAISEAEEAINYDPDMLDNWIHLGDLLRQSGQYGRAIEAFKNAAARDMPLGMWLGIQSNLAYLHLQDGDVQRAVDLFEMVLLNDSTMATAWVGLGVAYASQDRFQDARHVWERALVIEPQNSTTRSNLAQLAKMSKAGE